MPQLLRNVIAVVLGFVVGSAVNLALVTLGPSLIPPPAGVNVTSAEGLASGIHLFEPRHFVMPFLAHAVGTFAGALVACLVAASHKATLGHAIGVIFLCGGVAASFMIPAPAWFIAVDLLVAYLPMAWWASRIGSRLQAGKAASATP
ncbi:MAG TPA: hypothetical protein VFS82_10785 [Lysobacter sp.]|nr:hypothetical protein [Lysobacter sp.]